MWLNRNTLIVVVAVSVFCSCIVSGVTVWVMGKQTNAGLRTVQINMCDGTNMLRGFARLATHGGKAQPPNPRNLADFLLRIRDCEATFDEKRVVHVSDEVEVEFLLELSKFRRVAIRDGHDLIHLP
jgi:Na+-transporting NADH:ubiquinone oxidoreductase subunit NqrC